MPIERKRPANVAEYIAAFPRPVQAVLKRVRGVIRKAIPDADEVISYGIPAYKLRGRIVVYFAGWKEHYSLYPVGDRLIAAVKTDAASYELSHKGTIRFPLTEPVPAPLIEAIARFRAKEVGARAMAKPVKAKKR